MATAGGEAAEEATTRLELEANTMEASAAVDQEAASTTVGVTTVEAATTEATVAAEGVGRHYP